MFLTKTNYNAFGEIDKFIERHHWSPPRLSNKELFLSFFVDDNRDMREVVARKLQAEQEIERERREKKKARLEAQSARLDLDEGLAPMSLEAHEGADEVARTQSALELCSLLILKKKDGLTEDELVDVQVRLDGLGVNYDDNETDPLVLCDALLDKYMDPKGVMAPNQKRNKVPIANKIVMKLREREFIDSKREQLKRELRAKVITLPGCMKTAGPFSTGQLYKLVLSDDLTGSNIMLHRTLYEGIYPPEPKYDNPIVEIKNRDNVVAYSRVADFHTDDDDIVYVGSTIYDTLTTTGVHSDDVVMKLCDSLPRLTHISMLFFGTDEERNELEQEIQRQVPEQLSKLASVQLGMEFPVVAENGDVLSVMVVGLKGEKPLRKLVGSAKSSVYDAIINNDIETVRRFIEMGYDLNTKPKKELLKPIAYAAWSTCNLEMIKLLHDAGAKVSKQVMANMIDGRVYRGCKATAEEILETLFPGYIEYSLKRLPEILAPSSKVTFHAGPGINKTGMYIRFMAEEWREIYYSNKKDGDIDIFAGYIPVGEQLIPFEVLKANPYLKDMYTLEEEPLRSMPKMTVWETLERMSPYTMLEIRGKSEQVLTDQERDDMTYEEEQEAIRSRIDAGKANEELSSFVTLVGVTLAKYRLFEMLDRTPFVHVFVPTNQAIEQFLRDNNLSPESLNEAFVSSFALSHITKDIDNVSEYVKSGGKDCRDVQTLAQVPAKLCIVGDNITYGGQPITSFIECSNGAIHVLAYPFVPQTATKRKARRRGDDLTINMKF